jgi:hypothetical protein
MNLMGNAAPHAQHGRLRPGSRPATRRAPRINQKGTDRVWCRKRHGRPAGRQKLVHRHRAGALQPEHHQRAGRGLLGRARWRWACRTTSTTYQVPGALEVPVALQALAESDNYDALIALGCIIRGETYHFELVANESAPASRAWRWTTSCRSPTPSSRPKTWSRPSPARSTRAATPPGRRRNGQPAGSLSACSHRMTGTFHGCPSKPKRPPQDRA